MRSSILKHSKRNVFIFVVMVLFVLGCTASAISADKQKGVVATAAADYSSGALSVIDVSPVGGQRDYENNLNPTISDTRVASYGHYFYRIESYMGDNIAKYDINNPTSPKWQYSTMDKNDDVTTTNPYDLVVVRPDKAYLLRYGTNTAWIVDPQASSAEEFKIGTLDLSAYDDGDNRSPEMNKGLVVDGKLFILMQRSNRNNDWRFKAGYIAVFDTSTDQEIQTWQGENGLKGIKLPIKNPGTINYVPENETIYVQGRGFVPFSGEPEYSGGIASIDPDTYQTEMILDDGNQQDHLYGVINGLITVNATKGYFVGQKGYGNSTIYSFNPSTGQVLGAPVPELKGINIPGMESGGGVDKNGLVWVTDATNAQVVIVDPSDDSVDQIVDTNLSPQDIAFVKYDDDNIDITANGQQGPLNINNWEKISLKAQYQAGQKAGQKSEWWIAALVNEKTWFSLDGLDPCMWIKNDLNYIQTETTEQAIYNNYFPIGSYDFYFLVDEKLNGQIDEPFVWDSIEINVTE